MHYDIEAIKPLDVTQLGAAASTRPYEKKQELKTISFQHHEAARMMARGVDDEIIARRLNKKAETVARWRLRDPAFQELLTGCVHQVENADLVALKSMGMLKAETLNLLAVRMAANPEQYKNRDLVDVAKMCMDRTGQGPTQKVETLGVTISGEEIIKMKQLAAEIERSKIIEPQNSPRIAESVDRRSSEEIQGCSEESTGSEEAGLRDRKGNGEIHPERENILAKTVKH